MNVKKIVFFVLLFVAVTLFFLPILKENLLKQKVKEGITVTGGEYEVGKDIPRGAFDFKVTGNLVVQGKSFGNGSHFKAMPLQEGEIISVEGKGNLHMEPAQYKKLSTAKGRKYVIVDSGYYLIGKQIPPGDYLITYEGEGELDKVPFVQTIDNDSNILKTFDFKNGRQISVKLHNNTVLQIEKTMMEEVADLKVILEKN